MNHSYLPGSYKPLDCASEVDECFKLFTLGVCFYPASLEQDSIPSALLYGSTGPRTPPMCLVGFHFTQSLLAFAVIYLIHKNNWTLRKWNTWRYCHGNLSYPSCELPGPWTQLQGARQLCPVLTLWKGSWCGFGSTCGCFPALERCPVEKGTSQWFLWKHLFGQCQQFSILMTLSLRAHLQEGLMRCR